MQIRVDPTCCDEFGVVTTFDESTGIEDEDRPITTAEATIADTNSPAPKTASVKDHGCHRTNCRINAIPPAITSPNPGGGARFRTEADVGGSLGVTGRSAATGKAPVASHRLRQHDHPGTDVGPAEGELGIVEILPDAAPGPECPKLFLRLER